MPLEYFSQNKFVRILPFFLSILVVLTLSRVSYGGEVIQPLTDDRVFEAFTLPNQMKVLLVSDPDTQKSAASLDVWVGSGDDPEDRQGLAHFLEHMLFLGTEKYPAAGEYQDFISGHGGAHNAYTSLHHTNYFFDIENKYLEPALDRFAQFFISPLFTAEYVERERNAVHSEFSSKIKDDYRRNREAFSEIVIPGHPLSHFSVGNLETLDVDSPRPLQQDLKKFYESYYSANRMALAVVSNRDITSLKSLVLAKFSAVKNRNVKPLPDFEKIFPEEFLPARLTTKPTRDSRSITFSFPVPDAKDDYLKKPLSYIGFFIGHEGKGSLLSALKAKNWAVGLSAGLGQRWRGGNLFSVSVTLTEQGVNKIDEIRHLLFEYIDLLKTKGIQKWRFDEISAVEDARFNFGDKIDPVRQASYLAAVLHEVPAKDVLRYSHLYAEFDAELIADYLTYFRRDNLFENLVNPDAETDRLGKYFSVPYKIERLSAERLLLSDSAKLAIKSLDAMLSLPEKNRFVANDFTVIGLSEQAEEKSKPLSLKAGKKVEVWFKNDDVYDLPKGKLAVRYRLPEVEASPTQAAAAKLYAGIIREALNEVSYKATMGGLGYSISATARGLDIEFGGFDDSLDELVKVVFKKIDKYNKSKKYRDKVNNANFERVKTELLRGQKNHQYATPYKQLLRRLPDYLYAPFWSVNDMIDAYDDLTLSEYNQIIDTMYKGSRASVFVFGNFSDKEGKKLSKKLGSLVPKKGEAIETFGKAVNLSKASGRYWQQQRVDHNDQVIARYIQARDDSMQEQAKMQLLSHMLAAPFYTHLRTERQLGYIVFSSYYPIRELPAVLMLVQSPSHNSVQLNKELDKFLATAENIVLGNFERDRAALAANLREKPKSQSQLADRFWESILKRDYQFDEQEKLAAIVESLSVEEMREYFRYVTSPKTSAFTVATENDEAFPEAFTAVENYKEFKAKKPFYRYP